MGASADLKGFSGASAGADLTDAVKVRAPHAPAQSVAVGGFAATISGHPSPREDAGGMAPHWPAPPPPSPRSASTAVH